jgi:hypothetical protein
MRPKENKEQEKKDKDDNINNNNTNNNIIYFIQGKKNSSLKYLTFFSNGFLFAAISISYLFK